VVRERNIELRDRKAEDNGDGNMVREKCLTGSYKPQTRNP